ncbi:hypothetical protein [Agromyces sp. NPDC058104]|uniref:hypothetical protein n=1 Tax=Agromyces sp. NPDC058104 TaxID=3346342 RepID=UPI0036D8F24C
MLISESTFPHLRAAEEARLARELERRRVVAERQAGDDSEPAHREPRRHRPRRARRAATAGSGWAAA